MSSSDLQCVRLAPHHATVLGHFVERLAADPISASLFHPHPLTAAQAQMVTDYQGRDYYAGGFIRNELVAYGMLRGWDQGYDVPSLGIAVAAHHTGLGHGRRMMEHLHAFARAAGTGTIMLRVYRHNIVAVELYRRMGYVLTPLNEHEWRGTLDLRSDPSTGNSP